MSEVIWLSAKYIKAAMAAVERRRQTPEAKAALKRRLAAHIDGEADGR